MHIPKLILYSTCVVYHEGIILFYKIELTIISDSSFAFMFVS